MECQSGDGTGHGGHCAGEFKDYTVIAISHQLDMIMDFNRMVFMDVGKITEVEDPAVLKDFPESRFGELVRVGGNYEFRWGERR
ncbi:Fum19p [Penicillium odoratum]|uniref:Fum19p n=1 Tax=Penicillium odoratum TaxID=1167516 RepID=UPI00254865C5|nr:Fum19p [Penicillium odoratum]KAJ5777595.1 Fum19p [Penicillium odoratum]